MRILRAAGLGVAGTLVVAAGGVTALLASPSLLTRTAEHVGSALIGRNLHIGRLSVRWDDTIRLEAEDLTISNTAWGSTATMASVSRIEADVDTWSLLHGRLVLRHLWVTKPDVLLEASASGEANWPHVASWAKTRPFVAEIHDAGIEAGSVTFHSMSTGTRIAAELTELRLKTTDSATPPAFTMTGRVRDQPFHFAGTIGSWDQLNAPSHPYPVNLKGEFAGIGIAVEGTSGEPLRALDTRLHYALDGQTLSGMSELIGFQWSRTPDFRASGEISRGQGEWSVDRFDARFGTSKFNGSATFDPYRPTPTLKMRLIASQLNLADFRYLPIRMLSGVRIAPDVFSAANADVSFEAERISGVAGLPIGQVTARMLLDRGILQLERARVGIASGEITTQARYTPSRDAPTLQVEFELRQIDLHKLAASQAAPNLAKATSGKLKGSAQIRTTGVTLQEMSSRMNGDVGFFLQGGSISALATASLQTDLLRVIGLAGSSDQAVRLNCLVSHFVFRDGVAVASPLVLDTDDLTAVATGSINVGQETLSLKLVPHPKNYHPLTLAKPFDLEGSIWKPKMRSNSGGPASDVGSAIASLIPSAGDLPSLAGASDQGDNAVCSHAIAEARRPATKLAPLPQDADYESGTHRKTGQPTEQKQ